MPRLPTAEDFGGRPIPQGGGVPRASRAGEIMAEGLGNAAAQVTQLGRQQMELEDRFTYTQARSNLLAADLEARSALATDNDWSTHTQRYRDTMTKEVAKAAEGIRSNPDRAAFVQESRLDMLRGAIQVQEDARRKETDSGRAVLQETLDRNRQGALLEPTEHGREAFIQNTLDSISAAKERGYITEQEAQAQQRGWTEDYAEGHLMTLPPAERLEMLNNPKGTPVEYIPVDRRIQLDDAARAQLLADAELAHRFAERSQKDQADAAFKDGTTLLHSGQLTAEWIEARREILDPRDMEHFYSKLSGGESTTSDPIIYSGLSERAGMGQDVRDEAKGAYTSGSLARGDYDRIVSTVEEQRPSAYKRGVQYIATSAAVSDLNPDPAAAQRKAIMLDEWNEWTQANQGATDKEKTEEYKAIVNRWSIVDRNEMVLLKKPPRFLVGHTSTLSQENLDATEQQTLDALDRGEISEEEAAREAETIREFRRLITVDEPEAKGKK